MIQGKALFEDITEDGYDLYVQAPNHKSIRVQVVPSYPGLTTFTVFLERTAVTYSL